MLPPARAPSAPRTTADVEPPRDRRRRRGRSGMVSGWREGSGRSRWRIGWSFGVVFVRRPRKTRDRAIRTNATGLQARRQHHPDSWRRGVGGNRGRRTLLLFAPPLDLVAHPAAVLAVERLCDGHDQRVGARVGGEHARPSHRLQNHPVAAADQEYRQQRRIQSRFPQKTSHATGTMHADFLSLDRRKATCRDRRRLLAERQKGGPRVDRSPTDAL